MIDRWMCGACVAPFVQRPLSYLEHVFGGGDVEFVQEASEKGGHDDNQAIMNGQLAGS